MGTRGATVAESAGPEVMCSRRFHRSYRKSVPKLRRLAEGATHDLIRRYRSDPKTWTRGYDRVAGIDRPVLEIDLAGGPRMLATWEAPRVTLLDMGGHELVPDARRMDLDQALADVQPAPALFFPESPAEFFLRNPDPQVFNYGGLEMDPAWTYWLDEQQALALDELVDAVTDAILRGQGAKRSLLLIGGPGTGKTSVLASLADVAVNELKVGVQFQASEEVVRYLSVSSADALPWTSLTGPGEADVVIIDDPADLRVITHHLTNPFASGDPVVVVGFDPLQMSRTLEDREFDEFVDSTGSRVLELSRCYRQKQNVGLATKRIMDSIAEKTAFREANKRRDFQQRHERLTTLGNELEFVNPHGYVEVHEEAGPAVFWTELRRIIDSQRFVSHWPSVLLAIEGGDEYHELMTKRLPFSLASCGFHEVESVKGLEFAHVFVFVTRRTYRELLDTTNGPGRKEYMRQRQLRIPFSRARDSLVTFVVDPDAVVLSWLSWP